MLFITYVCAELIIHTYMVKDAKIQKQFFQINYPISYNIVEFSTSKIVKMGKYSRNEEVLQFTTIPEIGFEYITCHLLGNQVNC